MENAYWIDPKGDIIPVKVLHIVTVIENPELFNLKKDDILKTYEKYNENIGLEGKAREEIMYNLIQKNYFRLRYNTRSDFWTIQMKEFNEKSKKFIRKWVKNVKPKKYSEIKILTNTSSFTSSVNDIENDKGEFIKSNELKNFNKEYLKIKHTINPVLKKYLDKTYGHEKVSDKLSHGYTLPKGMSKAQYNFITKTEDVNLCFSEYTKLLKECEKLFNLKGIENEI